MGRTDDPKDKSHPDFSNVQSGSSSSTIDEQIHVATFPTGPVSRVHGSKGRQSVQDRQKRIRRCEQMEENLQAVTLKSKLTPDIMTEIDRILDNHPPPQFNYRDS